MRIQTASRLRFCATQVNKDPKHQPFVACCTTGSLAAAGSAITKVVITTGTAPIDLHLRFGGLNTLSLTHVKLRLDSYSDLGHLKQLQSLTLTDIGRHLHSLHHLLAEHYKLNIAVNRKLRDRGPDRTKICLVASMPPSNNTLGELYDIVSGHHPRHVRRPVPAAAQQAINPAVKRATVLDDVQSPAGGSDLDTATPFASKQGCVPFSFLTGLTELTLSEYPRARLPVQDMQQLSLLTNLRSLTLKQIWGVGVPYQALASLSYLTALHIDTSQEQKCLFTLPACLTGLHSLSVECTRPSISFFLPASSQYTALTALTVLSLTEVEDVSSEALASLTSFRHVEHLSIKGRDLGEAGGQVWPETHDWQQITALTAVKHLELDHIDHGMGICRHLGKLTQLTHLRLASMQNVYHQEMQEDLLSLAALPRLHLLHCSFVCFHVRSTFASDLENKVIQQRGRPIQDFKIDLNMTLFHDYEVESDDVDDETAMERERDQQREQAMRQWHEENYSERERREHERDPELMQQVFDEAGW